VTIYRFTKCNLPDLKIETGKLPIAFDDGKDMHGKKYGPSTVDFEIKNVETLDPGT